jgi:hypothetical protein
MIKEAHFDTWLPSLTWPGLENGTLAAITWQVRGPVALSQSPGLVIFF